jgi:hypothetical protein
VGSKDNCKVVRMITMYTISLKVVNDYSGGTLFNCG